MTIEADAPKKKSGTAPASTARSRGEDAILSTLGARLKMQRARKAMPRRALAEAAGVSERHLANLESGSGNASLLVLQQIAQALGVSVAELVGDDAWMNPERVLIRQLLNGRSEEDLQRARRRLVDLFGETTFSGARTDHIALIGLRGAGKTTLGRMLAQEFNRPFVEIGREITRLAGCGPAEIEALYGPNAYRRYERRALEDALQNHPQCVIATPGGLVSDAASFNFVLSRCYTVWLQAGPEEHMNRVIAQGDLRPMAGSQEAMDDLKAILTTRTPFYEKADLAYNTSGETPEQSFAGLAEKLRAVMAA
jgi:XRE family aerobic/anaerobic benzoate catabolism transcriptional regulator